MTHHPDYSDPPVAIPANAGTRYRGWDENLYELVAQYQCGVHLRLVEFGPRRIGDRQIGAIACVSPRAINHSFREVRP